MDFAMGAEKRNAAQMETLLDSSINGVMRLDGEGKVLSANPAMEQMMGKEEREVTGSSLWAIFPETEREGLKKALETGEENCSCFLRIGNGAYLADLAPIVVDGHVDGAVFTCTRIRPRTAARERDAGGKDGGEPSPGGISGICSRSPRPCRPASGRRSSTPWSDSPVVIQGECGTEKRLLAQCIHNNGVGSAGAVCPRGLRGFDGGGAGVPDFRGERGGGPGGRGEPVSGKRGAFVPGGPGLPVPIGETSAAQGKEGFAETQADVRVILGTERSLAELTREGRFSRELFFSVGGLAVEIPPLRERAEDLERQIDDSLRAMCDRYSRYHVLTAGARKALCAYSWRGIWRRWRISWSGWC